MQGLQENAFLSKLWQIISDPANSKIISWNDDGTHVEVKDPEELGNQILGKHFKHTKFASFQRQLNYFGFKKQGRSKGNDTILYFHQLFKRSSPAEVCLSRCVFCARDLNPRPPPP
jgi:hypothetical protein